MKNGKNERDGEKEGERMNKHKKERVLMFDCVSERERE